MASLRAIRLLWIVAGALIWAALPSSSRAQYRAGDVVGTNFGFVTRYRWTNDNGQVFLPGSVFRLSDFDGKIVFFMFFDVW